METVEEDRGEWRGWRRMEYGVNEGGWRVEEAELVGWISDTYSIAFLWSFIIV